MGDPVQRQAHIKDATDFFDELEHGRLPAVSYLKPDSFDDGHPASSKLDLLESMMTRVVDVAVHQVNGRGFPLRSDPLPLSHSRR